MHNGAKTSCFSRTRAEQRMHLLTTFKLGLTSQDPYTISQESGNFRTDLPDLTRPQGPVLSKLCIVYLIISSLAACKSGYIYRTFTIWYTAYGYDFGGCFGSVQDGIFGFCIFLSSHAISIGLYTGLCSEGDWFLLTVKSSHSFSQFESGTCLQELSSRLLSDLPSVSLHLDSPLITEVSWCLNFHSQSRVVPFLRIFWKSLLRVFFNNSFLWFIIYLARQNICCGHACHSNVIIGLPSFVLHHLPYSIPLLTSIIIFSQILFWIRWNSLSVGIKSNLEICFWIS